MTFLRRFLLVPAAGVVDCVVGWCPLLSRAAVYAGIALRNSSSLQDSDDILPGMAPGSCFTMVGGGLIGRGCIAIHYLVFDMANICQSLDQK